MANQSNQPNRKSEKIRRANRLIQTRTFLLMLVMGLGVFVLIFAKLWQLQIVRHEELQNKALDQQTRSTEITANRGTIYDRGGNILAISATAETIFLSPLERLSMPVRPSVSAIFCRWFCMRFSSSIISHT